MLPLLSQELPQIQTHSMQKTKIGQKPSADCLSNQNNLIPTSWSTIANFVQRDFFASFPSQQCSQSRSLNAPQNHGQPAFLNVFQKSYQMVQMLHLQLLSVKLQYLVFSNPYLEF